jgi:hypothetical protein
MKLRKPSQVPAFRHLQGLTSFQSADNLGSLSCNLLESLITEGNGGYRWGELGGSLWGPVGGESV